MPCRFASGGSAPAQDLGCTWPDSPGGQIIAPDTVALGETIGFGVEFDEPGEGNYAIDQVFDVRFHPNARGRERVSVVRAGCRLAGGCPGP